MFSLPNSGVGAGVVKSIQRGAASAIPNQGTNITINPVDVSKTVFLLMGNYDNGTSSSVIASLPRPDTLNLASITGNPVSTVPWQLVEYF